MEDIKKITNDLANQAKKTAEKTISESDTATALRDTTYQMLALSLVVQSLLWNTIEWESKVTLQIALCSFMYSGWIKKIKDVIIERSGAMLGLKDSEKLKLQRQTDELLAKNSTLDMLVNKLNAMAFPPKQEEKKV